MIILNLAALAVLAATLVVGCEAREQPADHKTDGTGKSDNAPPVRKGVEMSNDAEGKYATVNGLKMYYEIHGTGRPLVLLHGAFGRTTVYPTLAKNRQVIAVELQGHGHTADIDRPLTYEQMADDTAALLKELKVEQADFFGYSMGGNVGLAVAIRHPNLVRKLAINGSHAGKMADAYNPETFGQFRSLPADFAPPMLKDPYDQVAPDPKQWPTLVAKVKEMGLEFKGFAREDLKSIKAHVLITIGDRDGVRPEHAVEMFRLIPDAELAVFPGADHFLLWQSPEKLLPTIAAFLDAPMPGPKKPEGR
jgi:pimeloyl-ACP methyl ester carboxylesterase